MDERIMHIQHCMYQYSRAIYRSIKDLIDPYVDGETHLEYRREVLAACEGTMERLAADPHYHFIQMPLRAWPRAAPSELLSKRRSELQNPATDGLIGNVEATLREKIFNVPIAQREA